jgi:hypothetical protein
MTFPKYQSSPSELSRLEEVFGLSHEAVQDIVMQGLLVRTTVSAHHPKTFAGTAQWAETVRALRDKTVPSGWEALDVNNCPLVLHPNGVVMIAVQTGDRETGTSGIPSNRAPKGSVTEGAVVENFRQFCLFDEQDLPSIEAANGRVLWVLLYHLANGEIRYELSLPMEMIGGKIRTWQERIVFPAIRLDGSDIDMGERDDDNDIDVSIERRPKQ